MVEAADINQCSKDKDSEHNLSEEISGDPEEDIFPDQSPTLAIYEKLEINASSFRLSSNDEADASSVFCEPSHLTAHEKVLVNDEAESLNFRESISGGKVEVEDSSIKYGPSIPAPTDQDQSPQKVKLYILIVA